MLQEPRALPLAPCRTHALLDKRHGIDIEVIAPVAVVEMAELAELGEHDVAGEGGAALGRRACFR